ncbi:unnamed protein product [Rotaria sp. Silwood2]|nr:unnamed protein product [Rotaria sp. Silwood2]CAF2880761.1 unnamed protein product [Rotaria sp. Silwood2]CAF3222898.1 unnamed protein product [Rotaria sp. Silwood2]CAF3344734.1 unnamed protein product [Rotaria sp. Silwood2]CAF4081745.1 unnamed protein product [Rotaria sp. Silwood2]
MTKLDFYRLIGFLFYGSLVRLPCKSDYWTATCGLETVTKSITRDRVDELLRSLHFNDNVLQVHVIDKIQPLINLFNDQCGSIVNPEKIISVDEQMVGYKGKSAPKSLKQYMPQKPTQRGFKFWSMCGSSSYTYRVKLYQGANELKPVVQTISSSSLPRTTTNLYVRHVHHFKMMIIRKN